MRFIRLLAGAAIMGGCALSRPDHFYLLESAAPRTLDARSTFVAQVTLRVSLPVLVDRSELVLVNPDGVQILEHERWASPLADQINTVLGQDIEARRQDVILASRRIAQPGVPNATISVDIVQLYLRRGSGVRLEARWRVEKAEGAPASQGRETFTAPSGDANVQSLARSMDACLGLLADRLVAELSN